MWARLRAYLRARLKPSPAPSTEEQQLRVMEQRVDLAHQAARQAIEKFEREDQRQADELAETVRQITGRLQD